MPPCCLLYKSAVYNDPNLLAFSTCLSHFCSSLGIMVDDGIQPSHGQVGSDARAAFHWPRAGAGGWFGGAAVAGAKNRRLVMRFCGQGWDWSGEVLPEGGEESTLRVRNGRTREVAFVRVGVSTKDSSIHLVSLRLVRFLQSTHGNARFTCRCFFRRVWWL